MGNLLFVWDENIIYLKHHRIDCQVTVLKQMGYYFDKFGIPISHSYFAYQSVTSYYISDLVNSCGHIEEDNKEFNSVLGSYRERNNGLYDY